jgi:hypothetical protein
VCVFVSARTHERERESVFAYSIYVFLFELKRLEKVYGKFKLEKFLFSLFFYHLMPHFLRSHLNDVMSFD